MAKITDSDHRLVAEKAYQFNVESLKATWSLAAEYGRWLITTVAAVHFGGLYLLTTIEKLGTSARLPAAWVFVIGLMLILLCGFVTWINWNLHAAIYRDWSDANMLVETDRWPNPKEAEKRNPRIVLTHYLTLVLGFASVLCVPIGMYVLSSQMAPSASP